MEKAPFNPSKCEARLEKHGYGIQCTRSPFGNGCLCKTHQNLFDKLPEGKDLPYGRFNQPRPDVTLDNNKPIKWASRKSDHSRPARRVKVSEMRDYLMNRIPIENFKGMKKKELKILYLEEKTKKQQKNRPPVAKNLGKDLKM